MLPTVFIQEPVMQGDDVSAPALQFLNRHKRQGALEHINRGFRRQRRKLISQNQFQLLGFHVVADVHERIDEIEVRDGVGKGLFGEIDMDRTWLVFCVASAVGLIGVV